MASIVVNRSADDEDFHAITWDDFVTAVRDAAQYEDVDVRETSGVSIVSWSEQRDELMFVLPGSNTSFTFKVTE